MITGTRVIFTAQGDVQAKLNDFHTWLNAFSTHAVTQVTAEGVYLFITYSYTA